MKPQTFLSRHHLLKAAETACKAHPRDAISAHRVFLTLLAEQGVRTHRLPELILWSIQGAMERSLGDAKQAAWRIQADLAPMTHWLRIGHDRHSAHTVAHAA